MLLHFSSVNVLVGVKDSSMWSELPDAVVELIVDVISSPAVDKHDTLLLAALSTAVEMLSWPGSLAYVQGAFEQIYPVLQEFKKVSAQADDDE